MTEDADNEAIHIKAEDILPATLSSSPEVEMLKKILDQMVENKRKHVRNEFIRLMLLVLVVFPVLLFGGFWLSRDILQQLREERLSAERSWNEMIQRLPEHDHNTSRLVSQTLDSPNATRNEIPDKGQYIISELEGKNKALSDLVRTQNKNIESLILEVLKARNSEIQGLHSRIDEQQTTMIMTESPEPDWPAGPASPGSPTLENLAINSLIIPLKGDIPFRVPIPKP